MARSTKTLSRKRSRNAGSTCDWQAVNQKLGTPRIKPSKSAPTLPDKSLIFRHKGNCAWKGVKSEAYKYGKGDWNKIIRRVLIGDRVKAGSHVRYFEVAPGGQSSFEKHRHEHIVIGIKGTGKVLLGKRSHKIGFLDVVYVSRNTPHQFLNPFKEPFGFICVVPSKRDKPKILTRNP